jgi:RNA polymerase sigma factor (sigma-70 family)
MVSSRLADPPERLPEPPGPSMTTCLRSYERMTPLPLGLSEERMTVDHSDIPGSSTQDAAQENEQLVRAIVDGDTEAERVFALRYLRPVRAMLLARSRNPDLTGDLLQDSMIEAICALRRGQLREPAKLTQFVLAITRNVLNNHFRSAVRRPESLELPDNLPDLTTATNQVEDQEREALAMHAIASLDPVDKTILQMTLVDGLKPGVIAERMRLSPDVVRQRKLRATRRVIDFVRRQSQTESSGHSIAGKVT